MSDAASPQTKRSTMLDRHAEMLNGALSAVYKETPEGELRARLFYPEVQFPEKFPAATSARPAVLFFSGGLWDHASQTQFVTHCLHYCKLGFVTAAVEYRLSGVNSIKDARTAFRWIRFNARETGVAPDRIVGVGSAAGAHAVAGAAYCHDAKLSEPGEDPDLSGSPNALILISPVLDVTKNGAGFHLFQDRKLSKLSSPALQIRKGDPPALILHGQNDRLVSAHHTELFAKMAKKRRVPCESHIFGGMQHGFFHFNVNPDFYESALSITDAFLEERGFLSEERL